MIALMGAVKHPSMQHPMAPPSLNAFQLIYMLPVYSIEERISSTRWLKNITEACICVVLTGRGQWSYYSNEPEGQSSTGYARG